MLSLLNFQRNNQQNASTTEPDDEKQEKRLYFHHAVEAKQPYFMAEAYPVSSPYHIVKKERSRELSVGGLYD